MQWLNVLLNKGHPIKTTLNIKMFPRQLKSCRKLNCRVGNPKHWATKHILETTLSVWASLIGRVGFSVRSTDKCSHFVVLIAVVGGAGPGFGVAPAQGGPPRAPWVVGASHLGGRWW